MRLFIAVDVPDAIKEAIENDVVSPLQPMLPDAKWTRRQGRHLTLKFLGNVDDARVGEVGAALRTAASRHSPFDAGFADVGGFPSLRRPRVLWVGIGEGAEPLAALARDVEEAFVPLGFEPEGRPFHGHFTLARFPRPKPIESLPVVDVPRERFCVNEVVLFRSQLHPKGARYTALESVGLNG